VIPRIPEPRRGLLWRSRHALELLLSLVRGVNVVAGEVETLRNQQPERQRHSQVQRFRFKSEEDDYYVCRPYDGDSDGSADIAVAKLPLDRGAASGRYVLNDELWAVMPLGGTGVDEISAGPPVIWLEMSPTGDTFSVKVLKDGGVDGDGTNNPTWTYTVKTKDGATTLATGLSPQRGRQPVQTFYGGEGGQSDWGLATVSSAGVLVLLEAYGETPRAALC
jgi:hypothetical protein